MAVRIRGNRVNLRDLAEDDLRIIYYHYFEAEDREFQKWDGPYYPTEVESYEEFAKGYLGVLAVTRTDKPRSRLVIEIDGELKGTVNWYWVSEETNWLEIGITIFDSRYWSGGYGTEAFKMWMQYLFDSLSTVRLGIATWSGNTRMMGLAAKCGMTLEGQIRRARIVCGEYYDAIRMGILREEWESRVSSQQLNSGVAEINSQQNDNTVKETGSTGLQGRADLHTHTQASDGMQPPAENVRIAFDKGLAAVAITDHDTVSGVAAALEAGRTYGITVVPGVEISTRAEGKEIHVLGYYIDFEEERFLSRLAAQRDTRAARNEAILARLRELGIDITLEQVVKNLGRDLKPDESIGRPHIADELVRLGAASDMRDAFDKYLADGAAAYVSPPRITPEEACEWILEAGGAPVLAHPGIYGDDKLVRGIIARSGLRGIEAYHSDHSPADAARYLAMAEEYGLLVTGGSDFHGARQGVVFHGDLGSVNVSADILEQLRDAALGNQ
ncbi:Spermidine N(1)-acetyltransferase [compost metagenome]